METKTTPRTPSVEKDGNKVFKSGLIVLTSLAGHKHGVGDLPKQQRQKHDDHDLAEDSCHWHFHHRTHQGLGRKGSGHGAQHPPHHCYAYTGLQVFLGETCPRDGDATGGDQGRQQLTKGE
jgi:hypothetical protein